MEQTTETLPPPPAAPAPAWPTLTAGEARVLGALAEKQITTPENYPLTLNALLAACNQKNNRDPVMALDETAVVPALDALREKRLVWQITLAGSRVPKYRHAFTDVYPVPEACLPLLIELLLRGPQTAAELRARAERMRPYADAAEVEAAMRRLAEHPQGPFAVRLPRETGRREARWAQTLCGAPPAPAAAAPGPDTAPESTAPALSRLDRLEAEIAALRADLAALQAHVESFTRQFEA